MLRTALLFQLAVVGGAAFAVVGRDALVVVGGDALAVVGDDAPPAHPALEPEARASGPVRGVGEGFEPRAAADSLVALVARLEGTARLEREDEAPRELRLGDLLGEGDRIVPDSGMVILLLRDGGTATVTSAVQVPSSAGEPSAPFVLARDLLVRFARWPGGGSPRSPEGERLPRPAAPTNGIPVRILTPTLHWHPEPEVQRYRLAIREAAGEVWSSDVEGDSLAMIPPEAALSPGHRYEWTVTSLPMGAPTATASFRVLEREGLDRVANELRALREAGLDPETDGALPAIALFQELDLVYDALSTLDRLIGPGEVAVSGALVSLRSYLRRTASPESARETGSATGTGGWDRR